MFVRSRRSHFGRQYVTLIEEADACGNVGDIVSSTVRPTGCWLSETSASGRRQNGDQRYAERTGVADPAVRADLAEVRGKYRDNIDPHSAPQRLGGP